MEGVTTAIVLFAFACVLFPQLVSNRAQYYIALGLTMLIILLTAIAPVTGRGYAGIRIFVAILQIGAILLLFLSAGGLTVRGLSRDMLGAFEVIRRGQKDKELIIPIGQEQKEKRRKSAVESKGEPLERYDLSADAAGGGGYPPKKPDPTPPPPKRDDGPIPLD